MGYRERQYHNIDCDFARLSEYFYAANSEDVDKLKVELDSCKRVGLPVSYVDKAPLPFDNYGAVRCDNQAEFHPRKYLLALANTIPGNGSFIFENTRALEIKEGMPCRVKTQRGSIIAKDVVVATHFPLTNRGLLFARMDIFRSYVLGIRAEEELEKAMFYSTEQPCHYIRSQPAQGGQLIMVGGEDHKVGQVTDTRERYKRLEKYVSSRFKVKSVDYSWSTQDNYSFGFTPFIGKITHDSMHVYVATGFRGNGMTYGTLSGMMISDMIPGKISPYRELYDPEHFKLSASAELIQKNIEVGKTFVEAGFSAPRASIISPTARPASLRLAEKKKPYTGMRRESYIQSLRSVRTWDASSGGTTQSCPGTARATLQGITMKAR